jgi:hypothetical protein
LSAHWFYFAVVVLSDFVSAFVSVGDDLDAAFDSPSFDLDAALGSAPAALDSLVTAPEADLRLSVMYQPEPLKMMPAG